MPVAQGINSTISENSQTGIQRTAFNATNPSGQRSTISTIFSDSPIHISSTNLLNSSLVSDRGGLFKGLAGQNNATFPEGLDTDAQKNAYLLKASFGNVISGTVEAGGFGFSSSTVNLGFNRSFSFSADFTGVAVPRGYTVTNGVRDDNTVLTDNPNIGHANLSTHGSLSSPTDAHTIKAAAVATNNFGTDIPSNFDTLGQYFNNI